MNKPTTSTVSTIEDREKLARELLAAEFRYRGEGGYVSRGEALRAILTALSLREGPSDEAQAVERLAAAYREGGFDASADMILNGQILDLERCAIRAIAALEGRSLIPQDQGR